MHRTLDLRPIVGILCSSEVFTYAGVPLRHQAVYEKYIQATVNYADAVPILIPADAIEGGEISEVVYRLNGILLPGGACNIRSSIYSSKLNVTGGEDPHRDKIFLKLILEAVQWNIPILGICRGLQEINVALGGTLIPDIIKAKNTTLHAVNTSQPFEMRYMNKHRLKVASSGIFDQEYILKDEIYVNSLHNQCIDELSPHLKVEAWSEDEIIEAVTHTNPNKRVLGVQWHPEWNVSQSKVNQQVWEWFRRMCHSKSTPL